MSETVDLKADIIDAAKIDLEKVLRETLDDIKGDVVLYGKELAQELGKWLWRWHQSPTEEAEKNLRHLRAKALLIAVRRGIIITRELQATLKNIVETVAKVALKALVAVVVAL